MGVCWGESCQGGVGQLPGEECQEAQTPDGNQMYFLGPERIFRTMEVGWGKLDYKKVFLISLKKKKKISKVFRFDFCFSEGCLCNFLKQDPRAPQSLSDAVVSQLRPLGLGRT